ncbi:MAG: peptidoglycan DD-metalloendopeptidase family protein [Myxococcota bacterium]|nr:peptidoglycan DD-metalloendopeptidase family protein [Myxococcota bacterium]
MNRHALWIGSSIAAAGIMILVVLVLTGARRPESSDLVPAAENVVPIEAASASPAPVPEPEVRVEIVTDGELSSGETLVGSLSRDGVDGYVAHLIDSGMAPVFNFRYARPGDRYRLVQDEQGEILRFDYVRSALERYVLRNEGGELIPSRYEPDLVREPARVAGVVSGSLYDAVEQLGEEPELAHDFAEIFAWDLDFSRSVRRGDEFAMLYERVHVRDEAQTDHLTYVHPGRILAARYTNTQDDYVALYYETQEGRGGYYRPDGSSVRRQFLKAPLNYRRISSRYSLNRLHPILGIRRPHPGIDYAADTGTPVWAVADGTVTFRGWNGGYGRMVKVRHANGYESWYAHLSRFPRDLRKGQHVQQKQILGYVGSSGLSTGPHLDYRLKHHGKWVNPASLRMPAGDPIPNEVLPRFYSTRDHLLAQLDPSPIAPLTNEAL